MKWGKRETRVAGKRKVAKVGEEGESPGAEDKSYILGVESGGKGWLGLAASACSKGTVTTEGKGAVAEVEGPGDDRGEDGMSITGGLPRGISCGGD